MKIIYATNGGTILVDDIDYSFLSQWSWSIIGKNQPARYEKKCRNLFIICCG